jgi:predicted porin
VAKPGSGSLYVGVFGILSAGLSWSVCPAADFDFYGVGHVSFDGIDTGLSSSDYIHSNSSRLGLKGAQDINDDLSVYIQYESGVDLTVHGTGDGNGGATSAGQVFTRARDSFVGVKSNTYGSLQFGRLGGLNQWVYDYNLFADQVGDLGDSFGADGLPGRVDSAAQYLSPTLYGLKLTLTFVPDEGGQNAHDEVVKVDYKGSDMLSGIKLGAAYGKFGSGVSALPGLETYAVTGSYDAGMFTVGAGWQHVKNIGGVSGADRDQVTSGATLKLGPNAVLKAQYTWSGDLGGVAGSAAHQLAAGLDYNLSPAAFVYIAYSRMSNSATSAFSGVDYGHGDFGVPALVPGKSEVAYSLGLFYKFDLSITQMIAGK